MTSEFPPFFGGGISTYMHQTATMLSRNGFLVTVFVLDRNIRSDEGPLKEELFEELFRVVRFNPENFGADVAYLGGNARNSYFFYEVIKSYIEREGLPFVLESQDYNAICYYILQKKLCLDPLLESLKIVVSLHCPHFVAASYNEVPLYELPTYWTGHLERFVIGAADVITSPSEYLVSELAKLKVRGVERAKIVRNPFEVCTYKLEETNDEKEGGEIFFLGKMQVSKGILDLVSAFRKLWDDGSKVALHIIGADAEHVTLGRSVRQIIESQYKAYLAKGMIVFEGKLSPKKVLKKLRGAKGLVVPSHFEAFPYVVVEAMALGVPVVVSDSGGHKELVQEFKSGLIFKSGSVDDLYEKLKLFFSLPTPDLIKYGENAVNRVQSECSFDTVCSAKIKAIKSSSNDDAEFPFVTDLSHRIEKFESCEDYKREVLSVIIPFFEMADYVNETINSITQQTFNNIESIIVNDGSVSKQARSTLEKLNSAENIKVIHQENLGLAEARNTGINNCSGEFVAFLDPDDLIDRDYFRQAILILKKYTNVGFVSTSAKYFGEANSIWPVWNPEPPYILIHNSVVSSAMVFKRDVLLRFGLNDKRMKYGMEDYESVINLLSNGIRGVAIPDPLFHYRVRSDSMSRGFNRKKILYLYSLIANKHKSLFGEFGADVSNLLNANGPGFLFDNPSFGPKRDEN